MKKEELKYRTEHYYTGIPRKQFYINKFGEVHGRSKKYFLKRKHSDNTLFSEIYTDFYYKNGIQFGQQKQF